jgi:excisionase family DNA binding protein
MSASEFRIDPNQVEPDQLELLRRLFSHNDRPALVHTDGKRIELPKAIFNLLLNVLHQMHHGRSIVLIPEGETLTTQAAAGILGVSRQYLVNLIEDGVIPFHKVGSHRRIYAKDLRAFELKRDEHRKSSLNQLFNTIRESGLYDSEDPDATAK